MRDLDLVSKLSDSERAVKEFQMRSISPNDGKYAAASDALRPYLSHAAELRMCARMQMTLLLARADMGLAPMEAARELIDNLNKFDPLNATLLEREVTKHDQLAVIEELGRHVSAETKALLHPGTTSYDILDTARGRLLKGAWGDVLRPKVGEVVGRLCSISERSQGILQVGRTHLQHTSPVPLETTFAGYAARLGKRVEYLDGAFGSLKGKVSGIVGTGASIEMVIGDQASEFERSVLQAMRLEPDLTATQVTAKETYCDVGNGLVTLHRVLARFAEDVRFWYSSDVLECTSRANAERLGGSSADAMKNNPINWENIAGKTAVIESGMRVLYALMDTDQQRDLRNSVQARYQPGGMIVETYESFCRASRALDQLSFNEDKLAENLRGVRANPSEALVAILRGEAYQHPEHGDAHSFVKEMAKKAKGEGNNLLDVCLDDDHFRQEIGHDGPSEEKRRILQGELELYTGHASKRARLNRAYARGVFE